MATTHTPEPAEYGESHCWCGADACIGPKRLLAGFYCARRRQDAATITALREALKAVTAALESQRDVALGNAAPEDYTAVDQARAALQMAGEK